MFKNNAKNKRLNSSILAIIILVLLLVCSFVLFFEINGYRTIQEENFDFYYYFANQRLDFNGKVSFNSKDKILSLSSEGITLSSSPVYYSNTDAMILPSNMEIVQPYKNSPMHSLGAFSKIYYRGSYLYANVENGIGRLYDCFLYDGNDLYVFLDDTTVIIGEDRYELNPMSFIEVGSDTIEIYNKKTDFHIVLSKTTGVMAYTDEYSIDLVSDAVNYNSSYYLLMKRPESLSLYEF